MELDRYLRAIEAKFSLSKYIPRRFSAVASGGDVPLEDYGLRGVFRDREPDLQELLKHPRVLILAEPGAGKSVVAKAAIRELIQSRRIPIFAELGSYRGNLNALLRAGAPADLFVENLVIENLLRERTYILDGMDEIPSEALRALKEDLERFLRADPNAAVLITARQAFYVGHRGILPNIPAIFRILDFNDEDIHDYVSSWNIDPDLFRDAINRVEAQEEARNPFILAVLVQKYLQSGSLSPFRTENLYYVINRLIESRPAVNQHRQRRALRMMGVALETYSRNELTEVECLKLFREAMEINEAEAQELLNELYASILKRTSNGLAFQIRSHGEYLAAEALQMETLARIQELVFLDNNTPNDSWGNAISYLCELNAPVRKFFAGRFPFWTIDSSPAAFYPSEKLQIVTSILDKLISEQQYATGDPRFKLRKLSRFVTPESEGRLVTDLASDDPIRRGNALAVLGILKKIPDLHSAIEVATDLTLPIGLRYSAIVALVNSENSNLVPLIIARQSNEDRLDLNVRDCFCALAREDQLFTVFPIMFQTNGMLSSAYYHMRELRSRAALVETLRYCITHPQEVNTIRAGGYIEPLFKLIRIHFDEEIARLCSDLLLSFEHSHTYIDRLGPLRDFHDSLCLVDRDGLVATTFFKNILAESLLPDWRLSVVRELIVSIMTVSSAWWLIDNNAINIIQSLAGHLQGQVREILRPHSNGVIDAQDEAARAYREADKAREESEKDRISSLQDRLLHRHTLDDVLSDFAELTPSNWPEIPGVFRQWLTAELSRRLVALDLGGRIVWRNNALTQPRELGLLLKVMDRYQLRVEPDFVLMWVVSGWDDATVLHHVERYGISADALALLARLIATTDSPHSRDHIVDFIERARLWSVPISESLRQIVQDASPLGWVKVRALNLLSDHGVTDEFIDNLRLNGGPDVSTRAFEILVERQHRATIERGLARLGEQELRAGETEFSRDSNLSWIAKINSAIYWNQLARLRERALLLELPQVTGVITNTLARIDRVRAARLLRQQVAIAPPEWREVQQHQAIEQERAARVEQAQRIPFDEVVQKLRKNTSLNKLKLLCEGQTDVPIFKSLLSQLSVAREVIFDFVGGWDGLKAKDPDSFLVGAKRAIVVMDGDEGRILTHSQRPLTNRAKRERRRLANAGVDFYVLKKYGIENYFPQAAIEQVTRTQLSRYFPIPEHVAVTERLSDGASGIWFRIRKVVAKFFKLAGPNPRRTLYHKNRNEEIALILQLESDLAGTDLYDIIHEIAVKVRALSHD